jgi:hypothetical protein
VCGYTPSPPPPGPSGPILPAASPPPPYYPVQWFVPGPLPGVPPKPLEAQARLALERLSRSIGHYQTFIACLLVLAVSGGVAATLTGVPAFFGISPTPQPIYCAANGTFPPSPLPSTAASPAVAGLTAVSAVALIAALIFVVQALVGWRRGVVELRGAVDPYGMGRAPASGRALVSIDNAVWTVSLLGIFLAVYGAAVGSVLSSVLSSVCASPPSLRTLLEPYSALVAAGAAILAGFLFLANRFLLKSLRHTSQLFERLGSLPSVDVARTTVYAGGALLLLGALSWVLPGLGALSAIGFAVLLFGFHRVGKVCDQWIDAHASPPPLAPPPGASGSSG